MRKVFPNVVGLFAGALLATAAFGLLVNGVLGKLISTPSALEVSGRFGLLPMSAYLAQPEPVESATFLSTLLAGFAFLTIAARAAIKLEFNKSARVLLWGLIACASVGSVAWMVVALSGPKTFQIGALVEPAIASDPKKFAFLVAVYAVFIAGVSMLPATGKWTFLPGSLVAIALATLASSSIVGNDDFYPVNTHYEVFVYPLTQDWLGSGISLGSNGQKSQYGLYPIFLRPLWYLVGGPSTLAITVVMAVLLFVSFLLLLLFITRFTRHPTLAAVLTLAAVMGSLLVVPMWPADPYFQFFPVRLLFPSIALGLLCRRTTRVDYLFLSYFVLAIGLVWNFESGVVALMTFGVFVLAADTRGGFSEVFRTILFHAFLAATAIAAVAAAVVVYYLVRFGSPPNFLGDLHSLRVFSSGIGALPMPWLGAWGLQCLVYSISLFVGFRALWLSTNSRERHEAAALLAVTAAGIMWFRYYQVRSAPPQLQFASLPALCCSALLIDRFLRFCGGKRWATAVISATIGAPLAAAISVWSLTSYAHPHSIARSSDPDATWNRVADGAIQAFEKVKQQEDDELFVLAPYAHLVDLKRGKASPIHAAGFCQIWFESDLADVLRVVSSPRTVMVVVDASPTCAPLQMMDHPVQDRLEPHLAALLRREFVQVENQDVEEDDCEHHPSFFVRKGLPLEGLRTTGEMTNVAEGKQASQSSSLAGTSPSLAVDGNVDGVFANGSTTHTEREQGPWWEVDLGVERDIRFIEIWNRTDCCGERLRDFWVFASDNRLPQHSRAASLATLPGVHSFFRPTSCRVTRIKAGFRARFVRVQLDRTDYLSLTEVRVFSH